MDTTIPVEVAAHTRASAPGTSTAAMAWTCPSIRPFSVRGQGCRDETGGLHGPGLPVGAGAQGAVEGHDAGLGRRECVEVRLPLA
ncbi:hypothetical protein ABIB27_003539 [Arthrobacter sp. UYEF21]